MVTEEGRAELERGRKLFYGIDEVQDEDEAVKHLLRAAWQGETDAMCLLGFIYLHGESGRDTHAAADWYLRAAEGGSVGAKYALLIDEYSLRDDERVKKYVGEHSIPDEAVRPLAENGDPMGQTLLGRMYASGLGVRRRDLRSAKLWYKRAAAQGDPEAIYRLAMLFRHHPLMLNEKDAAVNVWEMLKIAADRGISPAVRDFRDLAALGRSFVEALGSLTPEEIADLLKDDGE